MIDSSGACTTLSKATPHASTLVFRDEENEESMSQMLAERKHTAKICKRKDPGVQSFETGRVWTFSKGSEQRSHVVLMNVF